MKRILTFTLFTFCISVLNAQLLTEDFNFSGAILGNNSWISAAATYTGPAISTGNGLTYTGFAGSTIGNAFVKSSPFAVKLEALPIVEPAKPV